jgi:hypothetical protein
MFDTCPPYRNLKKRAQQLIQGHRRTKNDLHIKHSFLRTWVKMSTSRLNGYQEIAPGRLEAGRITRPVEMSWLDSNPSCSARSQSPEWLRARAHQGNWQPQRNRNFREMSQISSRQLVSSLASAHWGNLRLISCSHHLNWVCSSDVMHDRIF